AIKTLTIDIKNNDPKVKKQNSNTEIEKQNNYKEIAKQFLNAYLNYDANKLEERREKIKPIATETLLNTVAPKEDTSSQNELSSDPSFSSRITNLNLYISDINQNLNKGEVVADITYEAKGSEGKVTVKSFVYLEIQTAEDGSMKVNNYVYYPIK
ncbi:hypothetical protein ACFVIJ_10355, partial [Heyndrickxia sporothermodurans]